MSRTDRGRPGPGRRLPFEVEVTASATSALIDAVHEVGRRPTRGAGRWRDGNVIDIDIPKVTDCTIGIAHSEAVCPRRPIAAVSIVTRRKARVDVVFGTDDRRTCAAFLAADRGSAVPDDYAIALAEHLAEETCAYLTAAGEPALYHAGSPR